MASPWRRSFGTVAASVSVALIGSMALSAYATPDPGRALAAGASTGSLVARQASRGETPNLQRVVIGRMYQGGRWTIPAATTYQGSYRPDRYPARLDRKIAYVCDALHYTRPTYVSGLIRLGWDDPVSSDMATVFSGVKECLRGRLDHPVKFDVVLNALHYTDPKYVGNAKQGKKRLLHKLQDVQRTLHPDGWFFDFYASPWKKGEGRFPSALEAGLKRIQHAKQFAGGTVWGTKVTIPPGDFVAITDRGRPLGKNRMEYIELMAKLYGKHRPVLMHIDNDPNNADTSAGSWWFRNPDSKLKARLKQYADGQRRLGYHYMFNVFFPLRNPKDPSVFDVMQRPKLFKAMCQHMRPNCGKPPTAASATAKKERPADRNAVHLGYNAGSRQNLYSTSLQEIRNAPGVRLETENAFQLAATPIAGTVPFDRCYLGRGWHLLTGPGCEGAPGAIDEGTMGYIATTRLPGTRPLHRLFNPAVPDHYYTTNPAKRDKAVRHGYTYEGVAGYVWKSR